MPCKLSFRAALVAAALAALAARQVTSAQFDSLAQDCNENNIKIIKSPSGPTDPDPAFEIEVFEVDQGTANACGKAAADIVCKSLGFVSTGSISQSFAYTKGECLMRPPPGQFDSLAQDCNENKIKIIKSPVGPTDFNRAFEIEVSEVDQETANACGKAAADILCKSLGFKLTGFISQSWFTTKGECLMEPPNAAAVRFRALASDCEEQRIIVLREPSATDVDLTVRVEVDEFGDVAQQACGLAAAREACKTNIRGFATAVQLDQRGPIVQGVCSN